MMKSNSPGTGNGSSMGKLPPVLPWLGYNTVAVPLLVSGMYLAGFVSEKAKQGSDGRRKLAARLALNEARLRGCVWVHVSSAGEYEQARPLLRALRERLGGNVPTLLTVFSPSGHAHATAHPETDVVEYLPLDTVFAMEHLLARLRPIALVFVRYDCWPNLVWSARRRGVPRVLLGASLHARSQRLRPVARKFFGSVYQHFDAIGTIDESDSVQFREGFDVEPARLRVVGDTRVDQVMHRYERAAESEFPKSLAASGLRYVVLGSVWPADEQAVLAPALELVQQDRSVGLLIAPHEPTPEHLRSLAERARAKGLEPSRLSELVELESGRRRGTAPTDPERWRVVLVDTVGVLAELYRAGIAAYVGGGFTTGVHSVLEPAVCGLPVVFGPRHVNSAAAGHLLDRRAATLVHDASSAQRALEALVHDEGERTEQGRRAQHYVQEQAGATGRSLDLLWEVLDRSAGTQSQRPDPGAST